VVSQRLLTGRHKLAPLSSIVSPATSQRLATVLQSIVLYPGLELRAEVPDETLQRPSKRLSERANSVALNLLGELLKHVDFALARLALVEAVHDLVGPLGALTAGRALAAGLVVVELGKAGDGADNVGRLVHDDDGGSSESGLCVLERVEVHQLVVADVLGQDRGRRTTGNDSEEVVPAALDTAAVTVNQLAERNRHLLLDGAGVVDMTGDGEKLGTGVALATEAGEPVASSSANGGSNSNGLDVGNGRRASEKTNSSGERGLETGLSGLALERLDEGSLLTADVGTHSAVDVDVEVVSGAAGVLSDETGLVGLLNGALKDGGLVVELATDVDVGSGSVHGASSNETALNELVGVLAHDLAVLACSGLTLIGVDNEVAGLGVVLPALGVHERLQPSVLLDGCTAWRVLRTHFRPEGKPAPPRPRRPEALTSEMICTVSAMSSALCTSAVSTHPVVALQQDLLRLVPVAVLHRALQIGAVVAVQVLEDTVLVLEAAVCALGRGIVHGGQGALLLL
jgi:hypothetical protein